MVGVYGAGDVTVSISGAPLAPAEQNEEIVFLRTPSLYCVFAAGCLKVQVFAYDPITIHD